VRALLRRTRWMSHSECCARHEASHAAAQPSHERHTRTHVVGIWGTGTGVQHSVRTQLTIIADGSTIGHRAAHDAGHMTKRDETEQSGGDQRRRHAGACRQ
jgi:hypothetical protein